MQKLLWKQVNTIPAFLSRVYQPTFETNQWIAEWLVLWWGLNHEHYLRYNVGTGYSTALSHQFFKHNIVLQLHQCKQFHQKLKMNIEDVSKFLVFYISAVQCERYGRKTEQTKTRQNNNTIKRSKLWATQVRHCTQLSFMVLAGLLISTLVVFWIRILQRISKSLTFGYI